jgi:SAM-dependent methyltransferase
MVLGLYPRRALRALVGAEIPSHQAPTLSESAPPPPPPEPTEPPTEPPVSELKAAYVEHVEHLKQHLPHDQAMEQAIGGGFAQIGPIEAGLVRHYGLADGGYLVDVGCGSGRLAKPLSADPNVRYLGIDLVPDLITYARTICARPDWRFEVIDHIGIPEADGQADMVSFFSVLTHLLHEQGYWYLEEARRVLKPGGHVVFSFLEFQEPVHWANFDIVLNAQKTRAPVPMNVFHDRAFLPIWAARLGMDVVDIRGAAEVIAPEGNLGQALCVLRKPAA